MATVELSQAHTAIVGGGATPAQRISQAYVNVVGSSVSARVDMSQAYAQVIARSVTPEIQLTNAFVTIIGDLTTGEICLTQGHVKVIVGGRIANPKIRAWTYTLDGHDFYVLTLGNEETLVYDRATGQWSQWAGGETAIWQAFTGMNWVGAETLARDIGAPVIAGDDGNGALYFLNPEKADDDDRLLGEERPRIFTRRITGQISTRDYKHQPNYGVLVGGAVGKQLTASVETVTLRTSDNRGKSYDDHGTITVPQSETNFNLAWRSLGSYKAPGRLFQLTDFGALHRVDYMEALEDE